MRWLVAAFLVLGLSVDDWATAKTYGHCTEIKPWCTGHKESSCVCDDNKQCGWWCVVESCE